MGPGPFETPRVERRGLGALFGTTSGATTGLRASYTLSSRIVSADAPTPFTVTTLPAKARRQSCDWWWKRRAKSGVMPAKTPA